MKKTVYQCDRCGKKFDFLREKVIEVAYNEQYAYSFDIIQGRKDYCISCFKEFEKFMKMDRSNILWE